MEIKMKELINLKYGPPKSTIIVKSYLKGDNFITHTRTLIPSA